MKRTFLICILSFLSVQLFAQYVLTTEGFVIEDAQECAFVELEFDSMTRNELFKKTLLYFEEALGSHKGLKMSNLRNEQLIIEGVAENAAVWKQFRDNDLYMDMDFGWGLKFGNGRILVGVPEIYELFSGNLPAQLIKVKDHAAGGVYIYKKNGEVRHHQLKQNLERFFNGHIHSLIHFIEDDYCEHEH